MGRPGNGQTGEEDGQEDNEREGIFVILHRALVSVPGPQSAVIVGRRWDGGSISLPPVGTWILLVSNGYKQ
jgi:hypothetical protein